MDAPHVDDGGPEPISINQSIHAQRPAKQLLRCIPQDHVGPVPANNKRNRNNATSEENPGAKNPACSRRRRSSNNGGLNGSSATKTSSLIGYAH